MMANEVGSWIPRTRANAQSENPEMNHANNPTSVNPSAVGLPGAVAPLLEDVRRRIVEIRGRSVIVDADVAALYGVATKRVNEAVRNNPDKFPPDYLFELDANELDDLRTKISTTKLSSKSRALPKAFTEKGLYMLATVLKSRRATETTFAIIETFAKVRALKRDLVALHEEPDAEKKAARARRFGELLADVVMPDADTVETESSLELNFLVGKIKHVVKKILRNPSNGSQSAQER